MAPTLAATFLIIGGVVRKGIMKERWANAFTVSSLIIGLYGAILLAEFVGDQADFTLLLFVFLNVLALCSAFLGSWGWVNKAEKHQMSLVIRD